MPHCIYLRKSRADAEAEAHGEGETLARHEKILIELAARMKIKIDKIYREIVSGESIAARPVMQTMLSEVGTGMWNGVLVVEIERLARGDTADQGIVAQTFKYSNTKIITPMKTYDPNNEFDEEYFEFGLFMSRREYKTINRRLQQGRITSVNEGKYVGNKPPYGYKKVKLNDEKGFSLEPIPDEAEIVRNIFSCYIAGDGTSIIATRLNELHIPSYTGVVWSSPTVISIIRNPVYAGKIAWNRRKTEKHIVDGKLVKSRPRSNDYILKDGRHDPIVSYEMYTTANESRLNRRHISVQRKNGVRNPLVGLIECGICGHHMFRKAASGSAKATTLLCKTYGCNCVSSEISLVEDAVIEAIRKWLREHKLDTSIEVSTANDSTIALGRTAVVSMEKEISETATQRGKLYDLLERGIYTPDLFAERQAVLTTRLAELTAAKQRLLDELQNAVTIEEKKEYTQKVRRTLETYYDIKDAAGRNSALKSILTKAVYTKTVRNGSFDIHIFPNVLFLI